MKTYHLFLLGLLGSLLAGYPGDAQSLEATISAKKWQRRVVLIYANSAQNSALLQQKELFAAQQAGLTVRDIDVLVVLEGNLSAGDRSYLQRGDRKNFPSASFETYLIGKDGGVKQRFLKPVPAAELFRIIDAMPMRQSEMRGKQ